MVKKAQAQVWKVIVRPNKRDFANGVILVRAQYSVFKYEDRISIDGSENKRFVNAALAAYQDLEETQYDYDRIAGDLENLLNA